MYDARPTQCRTYPFWRENMLTPHDWQAEGARCEGVAAGREAVAVGSAAQQAEATVSAPSAIALAMFEEVRVLAPLELTGEPVEAGAKSIPARNRRTPTPTHNQVPPGSN